MPRSVLVLAALLVLGFGGCGTESEEGAPSGEQGGQGRHEDPAPPAAERAAREDAVIRYQGMPGMEELPPPFGGMSYLDFETGLPRQSCGCIVMPGQVEKDAAHNARVRAACARGELRRFQLNHKFMRLEEVQARFDREPGAILAPGQPVVTPDHTYRIELRQETYANGAYEGWLGYVRTSHAPEPAPEPAQGASSRPQPRRTHAPERRMGLFSNIADSLRVLFAHDDSTLLVRKGERQFEVHDLPTGQTVQVFYPR